MDSSYDSDSTDQESAGNVHLDTLITAAQAKHNYEEAGNLVLEDEDHLRIDDHEDLLDATTSTIILGEVVSDLSLPYKLSDFQTLSLNTLLQKKDLVLLSPTGSGKES